MFVAIDAHVDDDGSGFDHVGGDGMAAPHGGHHDVGLASVPPDVGRAAVADRDGGVGLQQQQRHGLAHRVAAADDHRVLAFDRGASALDEFHAAVRRGRPQARQAGHQLPGRVQGKAVHVFGGVDGANHRLRVNVLGQRHLHQDAVDGPVGVERRHPSQQLNLCQCGGVLLQHRVQPVVGAGLDLVADVDRAGGVFAHQDHGQARLTPLSGQF